MKKVFLFGYSGHAYVTADTVLSMGNELAGYFDMQEAASNPFGLEYFGPESEANLLKIVGSQYAFPAIGSNAIRRKLVELMEAQELKQLVVCHASAVVSPSASIALSTLIGPGAVINALAEIGKGCIINSSAVIEHECRIGNFSHIAPGAVLAGNVTVGTNTFIGAGSAVKQGIQIGHNAVIGAGSVVIRDIPDNETWAGNPARRIK